MSGTVEYRRQTTVSKVSVGYCDEFQAVYDAMDVLGNAPGATEADYMNTMVSDLVDGGYWARMDILYITAVHEAASAVINWKNPGTSNITDPGSTNPAWTAWLGYNGDNASDYLSTNFSPKSDGVNISINSCSLGSWQTADYAGGNDNTIGASDGRGFKLMPKTGGGSLYAMFNTGGLLDLGTNASQLGLSIATRRSSTDTQGYQNGVSTGTAVGGVPSDETDVDLYILASNEGGATGFCPDSYQLAIIFCMDGLASDPGGAAEALDLYNIFNTYMTAVAP